MRNYRNYFVYNGVDSRDLGLYISGSGTFAAPKRIYNTTVIPGLNGTVYTDTGAYENVKHTYNAAFMFENTEYNLEKLRQLLLADPGYHELYDSYHPNELRQAVYIENVQPTFSQDLSVSALNIEFECKPQRFLLSGQEEYTFNKATGGNLTNPTAWTAKPIMRVWGTGAGTLSFNTDYIISFANMDSYMDIDCEKMIAYKGSYNRTNYFSVSQGKVGNYIYTFPELKPNTTYNITMTGKITSVRIKPRWYII